MNTTPNINLSTYTSDPNDKFNLLVTFNNNMTKIDTAVGSQNDQIELIETTASTAVSTANTASATATEALTTAEGKTSVNDNVASTTTTYSSDKINDLISGIQPGTEIDDSVTSTTKTWSSSKINTEITAVETVANSKANINDTTAGSTTTYSSNKIESLVGEPYDISTRAQITNFTVNSTSGESNPILSTGMYVTASTLFDQYHAQPNTNIYLGVSDTIDGNYQQVLNYPVHKLDTAVNPTSTPIIYIKSGLYFKFVVQNAVVSSSGDTPIVFIHKIS